MTPARRVLVLACLAAIAGACSSSGGGTSSPTPTPTPVVLTAGAHTITSPGFSYAIDGGSAQEFSVQHGQTYTFTINTDATHPVRISTTVGGAQFAGATGDNINSGTITLVIPATGFPPTLFSYCTNHQFTLKFDVQ